MNRNVEKNSVEDKKQPLKEPKNGHTYRWLFFSIFLVLVVVAEFLPEIVGYFYEFRTPHRDNGIWKAGIWVGAWAISAFAKMIVQEVDSPDEVRF